MHNTINTYQLCNRTGDPGRKFITDTVATTARSTSALAGKTTETKNQAASRSTKSFVVKAGKDRFDQPILFRGKNPNLVKISAQDTDGLLTALEYEGFEQEGPPLHIHFNQDEVFYIVEGEYRVQVGDELKTLTVGDTIFLPRNVPHTWRQLSKKGKMFYLLQPAGKYEDFFKKLDALKRPPTEEEAQTFALECDMKFVGPPLALK